MRAGIPVMAHIGFTPQSEHGLGGHLIQGRGDGAKQLLDDAHAVEDAGAFAVVLEMVPSAVAAQVTKELTIPTISVGAGPHCDGQLMVWTDWAGFTTGRIPKFVKKYADIAADPARRRRHLSRRGRVRRVPLPRARVRRRLTGSQLRVPRVASRNSIKNVGISCTIDGSSSVSSASVTRMPCAVSDATIHLGRGSPTDATADSRSIVGQRVEPVLTSSEPVHQQRLPTSAELAAP